MTIRMVQRTERDWLQRIQAEYCEMPGLHLTKPQIQRLWHLDAAFCDSLLDVLLSTRVLRKTDRDAYVLDQRGVILH